MSKYLFGLLALVLVSILAISALSSAQAHRSGCHRWHSCPSDSGSYECGDLGYSTYCDNEPVSSSTQQSSSSGRSSSYNSMGFVSKPVAPKAKPKPKQARPTPPRYVVRGVAYFRVGSVNGSLGSLSVIKKGYYLVSVNNRYMQVRRGYKTIYYWLKKGGTQYKKIMKSPAIVLEGQLYMPVYAMGFLGCGVDTGVISSKTITLSCGDNSKVVSIRIW